MKKILYLMFLMLLSFGYTQDYRIKIEYELDPEDEYIGSRANNYSSFLRLHNSSYTGDYLTSKDGVYTYDSCKKVPSVYYERHIMNWEDTTIKRCYFDVDKSILNEKELYTFLRSSAYGYSGRWANGYEHKLKFKKPENGYKKCTTYTFKTLNPRSTDIATSIQSKVTIYIIPLHEQGVIDYNGSSQDLTIDTPFSLRYQSGNPDSGWYYSLDNGNEWEYLSNTNNITLRSLGLTETDLFRNGNRKILFQGNACGYYGVLSDILAVDLFRKPPSLVMPAEIKHLTCSYSSDGTIALNFSRNLDRSENEKMIVALYNLSSLGKYEFYKSYIKDEELVGKGNGIYQFVIPDKLSSGSYKVLYQTVYKSLDIKTDDEWTKQTPNTAPIIINKPKPLTYNITSITDESCYQSGDGIIELKAQGAENRTFYYQLNNGSWTHFEDSTYIRNLTKGNYKIMVKDSNDCYFRK